MFNIFGKAKQNQITIEQIDEIVRAHNRDIAEALKDTSLRLRTLEERCQKIETKVQETTSQENPIKWINSNLIPNMNQQNQEMKAELSELRSTITDNENQISEVREMVVNKVGWLKKYADDLEEARLKLKENGAKLSKLKA